MIRGKAWDNQLKDQTIAEMAQKILNLLKLGAKTQTKTSSNKKLKKMHNKKTY